MRRQRIIIVGGVASGPAAAAEARRTDPDADIVLFERDRHVSYGACELPYLAAGSVDEPERLVVLEPDELARSRRIDVRVLHEVSDLDLRERRATVRDLATGIVSQERFDKAILATGARATMAGIDAAEGADAYVLRTLEDGVALRDAVDRRSPGHAVVVGAGYIGLEVATLLHERGWRVTVLDANGPLGAHLDDEMVERLDDRLARVGIAVRRERAIAVRRSRPGPPVAVKTEKGELVGATLLLVAAGIEPVSQLGGDLVRRGANGTYLVDSTMRTSARGLWACGDCVSLPAFPDDRPRWIPLSPVGYRAAHVAGHNAARSGRQPERSLTRPVGNYTALVGGWEVASVGITRADATRLGMDAVFPVVRHVSASSMHPTSHPIHVGIVAERPSGRLLGAQLLGRTGATLRANVVAAVIAAGGTVTDLYDVDYGYAPPVAPSIDPLMVAARAAQKAIRSR